MRPGARTELAANGVVSGLTANAPFRLTYQGRAFVDSVQCPHPWRTNEPYHKVQFSFPFYGVWHNGADRMGMFVHATAARGDGLDFRKFEGMGIWAVGPEADGARSARRASS